MKPITDVDALTEEIEELKADLAGIREELDDAERKLSQFENDERTARTITAAVEEFLARVVRPVGKRTFLIKPGQMTDQAIVALHDAIGRNL